MQVALTKLVEKDEKKASLFDVLVKRYYIKTERYDWVDVARHLRGIESFFHRNRQRVVKKLVRKYGVGEDILDAGCGTGLNLMNFHSNPVGLDINPWNARKAKVYAPKAGIVVADTENMPFRDGSFSTLVCTESLEHMPHPEMALNEIRRTLSDGGRLIGSVPRISFLWRFRVLSSTCPHNEPFHNQYTPSQIKRMLAAFKLIKVKISSLGLNIVFIAEKCPQIDRVADFRFVPLTGRWH